MILKEADKLRLAKVLEILEALNLKFPNAEIKKRTGVDEGNISKYLKGKIPISDNFFTKFMDAFAPKKVYNIDIDTADVGKELSRLIEITIKQQAAINLLMKAFGSVSAKAVEKEFEKIFDEYAKTQ
jgi:transcriptional regulator with XRE-family HTH domain